MLNPVTLEEFDDLDTLRVSLLQSYATVLADEARVKEGKALLVQAIVANSDEVDDAKMTFGDLIKIKRRFNASYPRERGSQHPLRTLLETFGEDLLELVSIDYKEGGAGIGKLIAKLEAGKLDKNSKEFLMASALNEARQVNEGTPELTITEAGKRVLHSQG